MLRASTAFLATTAVGRLNPSQNAPFYCFIALIIIRVACSDVQFDWDEELYFQIARSWASGAPPYIAIFDHKPPFIYLYYLVFSGGGLWIGGVRTATAILLAGSTYYLFSSLVYARVAEARFINLHSAILLLLLSRDIASGTNSELIYIPFLLLCLAGLLRGKIILAVLAASLAVAVKYTAALDVLGIAILFFSISSDWRSALNRLVQWGLAVFACSATIYGAFLCYFYLHGVDLLHEIVTVNLVHGSEGRQSLLSKNPVTVFASQLIIGALVVAPFICQAPRFRFLVAATAWLALSLLQAALTGKYYWHYLLPAYVPVVLAASSIHFERRFYTAAAILVAVFTFLEAFEAMKRVRNYRRLANEYGAHCDLIKNGGYIATHFLAGYRVCNARLVDRFLFPPFYIDPHFARLAGSGGVPAFVDKVESGVIRAVITDRPNPAPPLNLNDVVEPRFRVYVD